MMWNLNLKGRKVVKVIGNVSYFFEDCCDLGIGIADSTWESNDANAQGVMPEPNADYWSYGA